MFSDNENTLENGVASEDIKLLYSYNLDEIEDELQKQLKEQMADLDFLKTEYAKISSPDALGEVIQRVIWEQFLNQIAVNVGCKYDLKKDAHIQTVDNFKKGKLATHNKEINYAERYDAWQNNFQRNDDGSIKTKADRFTGEQKAVLRTENRKADPEGKNFNTNYNARQFFDQNRPKGSKTVNNDHIVSAAEMIRDPAWNAFVPREKQEEFANSKKNLIELDARANASKGDSRMEDWLNSERDGKKPSERFPINEDELRKRDKDAREQYEQLKDAYEQYSAESGKRSRMNEFKQVGADAIKAVLLQLLAELVREIIGKFVEWLRSARKKLETLLEALEEAIASFVAKLKDHLISAADTAFTMLLSAVVGNVVGTIKKVWGMLKEGWSSLIEAIEYVKKPENKDKSIDILIIEVGKIIIMGMSAIGAMILSEVIEKALLTIPGIGVVLGSEIPMFGSPANIMGIFFGAVTAGIVGALIINLLQKQMEEILRSEFVEKQIDKGNDIVKVQDKLKKVNEAKLNYNKYAAATNINARHKEIMEMMHRSLKHTD